MLELGVIGRDQRIGWRYCGKRYAGCHAAKRQKRVLERIAGQDGKRTFGAQTLVEQELSDGTGLSCRFGISDLAPFAVRPAISEEQAIGCDTCPVIEPIDERARILTKRQLRTNMNYAVGRPLDAGRQLTHLDGPHARSTDDWH